MTSRFLNPIAPGGLLTATGREFTGNETLTVQKIAAGTYFYKNETPSGTVNGSNAVFTTANTVNPVTSINVYVNGQLMKAGGVDYTFSSTNTITFVVAPPTSSIILVDYISAP